MMRKSQQMLFWKINNLNLTKKAIDELGNNFDKTKKFYRLKDCFYVPLTDSLMLKKEDHYVATA